MIDLRILKSALEQLEQERGIPKAKTVEAIEMALAAAYRKDYGKKNQIIRAVFNLDSGTTEFFQVKEVVDASILRGGAEPADAPEGSGEAREVWNEDRHIMLADAQMIKKGAEVGDELIFPLELRDDFGRIAAQTAKQTIIQKIREAEKYSVLEEYGKRVGELVHGTVQRTERGHVYVDLGRTTGVLYRDEQIPGEHYRQGERIRCYLVAVEETPRGIAVRLSRAHADFVKKLFEIEVPEMSNGVVQIRAIAREAGSRTKLAVISNDDNIDAVGSCVGQRGVRVSTVISELGGEKIDIVEWSELPENFIANALSPGKILSIELDEDPREAKIWVAPDQLSLVIGKGGQNVRLAARLTGWKLDIITPEKEARNKISDIAELSSEGQLESEADKE
ncbi:MAG: transcription termination factor NusA [Parcubacteria group bacterium RIFCSPHIGHO2_01_FULL_45_26]|nr:MAG: transcription termination factor NusA [Parcubacteria group bacterium RIFCSPHIGHO2_01_FULL_45_26]